MKIFSKIVFITLLSGALFGQELEMATEVKVVGPSTGDIKYEFNVTNIGQDQARFYWDIQKGPDVPREWVFSICDANLCYPDGTESAPCSGVNIMETGESISWFKVEVRANDVAGKHDVVFRLIKECDSNETEVIEEAVITFQAESSSSTTSEGYSKGLVLYPNPTVDRFQVDNDENIATVSIFNIVGKNIYSDSHRAGKVHDVSQLENGFYLVRLLDRKQETIKVIRLTKE